MPLHVLLLYLLLLCNVLMRLFTNKLGILPKALNIADVFLTLSLLLMSFRFRSGNAGFPFSFKFGGKWFVFNVVLLAGALLNLEFFYAPAAWSQVIMWNEPLLLFVALARLPFTSEQIERFRVLFVRLLIFECIIGFLQVPLYAKTGATEEIIGTFYGNAEQYQGFVMLAVFYLLGCQHVDHKKRNRFRWMIGALLGLIVLIDNKATWLGVLVSILFVLHVQQRETPLALFRAKNLMFIVPLLGFCAFLAIQLSPSISKFSGLAEAWRTGNIRNLGKLKAFEDIFSAFVNHGHMWLVGSGPGNFYSRSGQQFYLLGASLSDSDKGAARAWSSRTSNSMGGVINPTGDRSPFYQQFYIDREIFRIGSGQVDSPFSSYTGLIGEAGLIGAAAYLMIYLGIVRRLKSSLEEAGARMPRIYPFALSALGLYIYMMTDSIYNSWLETGRITTIAWAMAALLSKATAASYSDEVSSIEEDPTLAYSTHRPAPTL